MAKMRSVRLLKAGITLFFGMVLCSSCDRNLSQKRLSEIESYIDSRPDSALAAIRQIDTAALRGRAVKAKYSLLHAIALDKNYIDTADTRIVQPAVDWYDRHGSPEERLKAYMYLGTEQYNAGQFNQAIVSFSKAAEFADKVEDQNLLGILYSRMADTFTMTNDHVAAGEYINESIACFRKCGRKDQERWSRLRQAINLTQRRMWDEADSCFSSILRDKSLDADFKDLVDVDYSIFLLSLPNSNDSLAYRHMSRALNNGFVITDDEQKLAYAYLAGLMGNKHLSDSLWKEMTNSYAIDEFEYRYWKHRESFKRGDFKNAYTELWLAFQARDSIMRVKSFYSAAPSQRKFLNQNLREKSIQVKVRDNVVLIAILICLLLAVGLCVILLHNIRNKRQAEEKEERMNLAIESLENQLLQAKNKAKFVFLSDLYENAYRNADKGADVVSFENVIRSKIGDLRSDKKAQMSFEKMVDQEMGGVMNRLRKSYPNLTESEFQMASYYIAGFDNITVMAIMGISSRENVRTKKRRLKQKLIESGEAGKQFAALLY